MQMNVRERRACKRHKSPLWDLVLNEIREHGAVSSWRVQELGETLGKEKHQSMDILLEMRCQSKVRRNLGGEYVLP
jgi:hypothetical protein